MLVPDVFRKQMYCIEESSCDFLHPTVIRRPGIRPPAPPNYVFGVKQ